MLSSGMVARAHHGRPLRASTRAVGPLVGRAVRRGLVAARHALSDAAFAVWRHNRKGSGPRVLIVDELVPDPLFGAGHPRAHAIVDELVRLGCAVSFYATDSPRRDVARMRRGFAGKVFFFPAAGADGLNRLVGRYGRGFDLLFISRPRPMRMFADGERRLPADGAPCVVYDAEAVLSPREERRRSLFGGAAAASSEHALAAELAPARLADVVSAVGSRDAATIAAAIRKPVVIVSHAVDRRPATPPFAGREDFLFVGRMTGDRQRSPNVDSAIWFATEVMPALDELIGDGYRVHLVGLQQGSDIGALPSGRIISHGAIDDLATMYDRCRVFVAPTRYAAGIPLKVVEAMGQGIPCVATTLLGEQLDVGTDVLPTGSSARAFAQQCARLYQDETAWTAVKEAALAHVARFYSRAALRQALEALLASADARSRQVER